MFSADQIADIQGFNKVYQNLLKQIDSAILETGYTLTEKDVLLEISKTERCTANILIQQLSIDRSYMSRMIAKFEKHGLIEKTQSQTDSRIRYVRLTELGRKEINRLSDIQSNHIGSIFNKLSEEDQQIVIWVIKIIRTAGAISSKQNCLRCKSPQRVGIRQQIPEARLLCGLRGFFMLSQLLNSSLYFPIILSVRLREIVKHAVLGV